MQGPLASLKVLDFSTLLPGPFASLLLADMGAEVLRIESPTRMDLLRVLPPHDAGFPPAMPISTATSAAWPWTSSVPKRWRWCGNWCRTTTLFSNSSARA
ncbi:hypothetical protein PBOI14_58060 [Pseudomonas sp. Boi14]|nr:hypothetical protein PBOI14_58060 [Pseudomonas sp. Boi14]